MPTILIYGLCLFLLLLLGFYLDLYTRYRVNPKVGVVLRINYVLLFVAFNFAYAYWQYCDAKTAREELTLAQDDLRQERQRLIAREKEMVAAAGGVRQGFAPGERKGLESPVGDLLTPGNYEVVLENADVRNAVATELTMSWPLQGGFQLLRDGPNRLRFRFVSKECANVLAEKLRACGGKVRIQEAICAE